MLNTTQIRLLVRWNPHRTSSMDWIRFNLIRNCGEGTDQPVTVGQFVTAHNALGTVGSTWNAKRYLRYMVERGQMELPGVVFARRAPRLPRDRAPAHLLPIAVGLEDFTFGVELECLLPRGVLVDDVARRLTDLGVDTRVEHLSHGVRTWWKIVTDGSLGDYINGREIVSPVLRGQSGLAQVETVCRELATIGCTVNKRCGFHVHVGQEANANNTEYFRRLLKLYAWHEAAIDSVMPPSRRINGFCAPVRTPSETATTVGELCRSVGCHGNRNSARYRKLNVDCWWSQRTVEFRQHSGTVEADKACNWIQFCLHFARFAASDKPLPRNVDLAALLDTLELNAELKTFFLGRAAWHAAREMRRAA